MICCTVCNDPDTSAATAAAAAAAAAAVLMLLPLLLLPATTEFTAAAAAAAAAAANPDVTNSVSATCYSFPACLPLTTVHPPRRRRTCRKRRDLCFLTHGYPRGHSQYPRVSTMSMRSHSFAMQCQDMCFLTQHQFITSHVCPIEDAALPVCR